MYSVVLLIFGFLLSVHHLEAKCGCSNQGYSNGMVSPDADGLLEGDMRLTPAQLLEANGFRNVINSERMKWPNGVVPYKITDWRHKIIKWNIKGALSALSKATGGCIKFREATSSDRDYIKVVYKSGCWSFIGRKGGAQELSLGFGCERRHTIQHEFIHALGFGHEQSRPDRDSHVKIHWGNIGSSHCHNFRKWGRLPAQGYDIKSIMHYGHKDFNCNSRWTISTLSGGKVGGSSLTSTDIAKLRSLYRCQ